MEYKLYYSNSLINIEVKLYDKSLYYHLQNYLISENEIPNNIDWTIVVYNKLYEEIDANLNFSEIKGEYDENLRTYDTEYGSIIENLRTLSIIYKKNKNEIEIYNSNIKMLFMDTYRAIRQILISDLLNRGGIVVHSSAISFDDMGYLFLGDKGAGKSTSVFQYLNSDYKNISYISNERNILLVVDKKILIYGWQSVAFIGIGTIKATIGLESLYDVHEKTGGTAIWLTEHKLIENKDIDKLLNMSDQEIDCIEEKLWLTPVEITKLTNRTIINYAYLEKVIFPKLMIDEPQKINVSKENLQPHIIWNLEFFGDWLNLRNSKYKSNTSLVKIKEYYNSIKKIQISGNDLVTNLNEL